MALDLAEVHLHWTEQLSTDDLRILDAQGRLYSAWGSLDPKHYREAELAYRRALELAPNIAAYHAALGLSLARQGQLEEGLTSLEHAVALDATDEMIYKYLQGFYTALGQHEEALWASMEAEKWKEGY